MKKIALLIVAMVACMSSANAQKFALVDMEYILKNIPAYEMANEQLNQVSQRWQREVEDLKKAADVMYKNYQSDKVFLTDDQIKSAIEYLRPLIAKYEIPIQNIVTHEMVRQAYKRKYPHQRCYGKVDITQKEYHRFMSALRQAL